MKSEIAYMGVRQLAEYLSISSHTIYSWCHQKKIPYSKINGKLIFNKSEIDRWISANRIDPIDWSEKAKGFMKELREL